MDENQTLQIPNYEGQDFTDPFQNAQEHVGPTLEADTTHELLGKYAAEVELHAQNVVALRQGRIAADTGANVAGVTDKTPYDQRRAA